LISHRTCRPNAEQAECEPLSIKRAATVLSIAPSTIHRLLNVEIIPGEQPTRGAFGPSG